jgi:Fe-S-cluster containining protein
MEELVTGQIKFTLKGEKIELNLSVPAKPVKLTRMLPVFQSMTNKFVDIGVKALAKNETISCTKGCGACCKQPVPISEVEAYHLAELVENLPEPQKTKVKEKFAAAHKFLSEKKWFEKMENFVKLEMKERQETAMEYFKYNIDCPFLEEGSCSIHPDRPLACREYLVTSPAENCSQPTLETVKPVKLISKLSDVLRGIGNSETNKKPKFVVLLQALDLAKRVPKQLPEKPGEVWMQDFFVGISKQA